MATIRIIGQIFAVVVFFSGTTFSTALAQSPATLQISADAETQQLLSRAETLLSGNDSKAAYALLSPHESDLAGNPYFDYLLGVAALDAGQISEAIMSLRRSLAVRPEFSGARMELARAYFETGNSAVARPLFVSLLDDQPPPGVRDVLEQYIRTIDASPAQLTSRFTRYAELFAGHDSNANGSTSEQQFMGFTLVPENLETDSPFAEVGAGFDWLIPKSTRFAWQLSARAAYRNNPDASFVDAAIVSGFAGVNWRRNAFFGRVGADGYWSSRDGDSNESYAGLDVVLGRQLSDRWDLTLGVRGGALRYDDSIEVLDVNRVLFTLGAAFRISSLARLNIEAIGGDDSEEHNGSPYGNSKAGGRISLSAPLGGSSQLYISAGGLTSDYDDLFFGESRQDTQLTSLLQLEFLDVFTPGLSIIPRVRYIDNDSDVSLYDYDRTEVGLMIRWVAQ
jgi:hypothetical protein